MSEHNPFPELSRSELIKILEGLVCWGQLDHQAGSFTPDRNIEKYGRKLHRLGITPAKLLEELRGESK